MGTGWDMAWVILLSSEIPFKRVEPVQKFNDVLTLLLVPEAGISSHWFDDYGQHEPLATKYVWTDCHSRTGDHPQPSNHTSPHLNDFKYFPSNPAHSRCARHRMIVLFLLLASLLNLFKSGKILLVHTFLGFYSNSSIFFSISTSIGLLEPEHFSPLSFRALPQVVWYWKNFACFSPRVHSISIDMNLLSNTLCCMVFISAALFVFHYVLYLLIHRKNMK